MIKICLGILVGFFDDYYGIYIFNLKINCVLSYLNYMYDRIFIIFLKRDNYYDCFKWNIMCFFFLEKCVLYNGLNSYCIDV